MARSPKDAGNVAKNVPHATGGSPRVTAKGPADGAIAGAGARRQARGQARGFETRTLALSAKRLQQIAEALDVPVSDFFIEAKNASGSDDPSPPTREIAALLDRLGPAERDVVARLVKALALRSGVEPT